MPEDIEAPTSIENSLPTGCSTGASKGRTGMKMSTRRFRAKQPLPLFANDFRLILLRQ